MRLVTGEQGAHLYQEVPGVLDLLEVRVLGDTQHTVGVLFPQPGQDLDLAALLLRGIAREGARERGIGVPKDQALAGPLPAGSGVELGDPHGRPAGRSLFSLARRRDARDSTLLHSRCWTVLQIEERCGMLEPAPIWQCAGSNYVWAAAMQCTAEPSVSPTECSPAAAAMEQKLAPAAQSTVSCDAVLALWQYPCLP